MNTPPDERAKRFVAILNRKIGIGRLLNVLGHMTAGLAGGYGKGNDTEVDSPGLTDGDLRRSMR